MRSPLNNAAALQNHAHFCVSNGGTAVGDAPEFIKVRHIDNCAKADPAYGEGVAKALSISLD